MFALVNLVIVVVNHYCFRTFAYDYGVYNFAFYDFAHFRVSACPLYLAPYPVSFMQDHFSITLILFSPLYWLLSWLTQSYTLLVIQWLLIVFGAWATYKLIVLKSKDDVTAALATLYYFVLYGRFSACDGDCNLAVIGSAVVPCFLYFFEAKKIPATIACFLFLVLNREDYTLWLFFICIYLMITTRKDAVKLRWSAILLAACVLFFFLIFKIFIPALEDDNIKFSFFRFDVLGKTPGEAFAFVFSHPLRAIELLFVNHSSNPDYIHVKQDFYMLYLLSGGVLLLYRPLYLIPFIPLLAKKMYTDEGFRWSLISYYSVEFVSILPIFVFTIIVVIKQPAIKYSLALLVCITTIIVSYRKIDAYWYDAYLGSVEKHNFFKETFYQSNYNISEINKALKQIPGNAALSGSCRLTSHMAWRDKIYLFPKVDDAQYICLFKHDDYYPLAEQSFKDKLAELRVDGNWKVLDEKSDFIVFIRKSR